MTAKIAGPPAKAGQDPLSSGGFPTIIQIACDLTMQVKSVATDGLLRLSNSSRP